ncbi:hypothetical protein FQN60_001982 [Etheostoma spectabile]|uniref:DUF3528 domain-containing protein n=1 Tax=Etheostoma spectabile TaxID=54343 RepID=A0A5J5DBI1_9PERO|nr:hypothetical protein FQN60_001982 [Etheostoma spectabile]
MFNSVNLGNFCSQTRKDRTSEFGDRTGCASNIYLPSCTYYVPEFSAVSSFLPQAPSRQISYPYSTNLSQVQPVREVSYGLDPASKWHRSNYASCYSGEDLVHRDCLPPSTMTEMLMKNENVYSHHHHHHTHPGSNHPSTGFYSGVGKNSVLPQGFDRFFETAYCSSTDNQSDNCLQKGEGGKLESASQQQQQQQEPIASVLGAPEQEKDPEDEEEHTNSGSCTSSSATTKDGTANKSSHSNWARQRTRGRTGGRSDKGNAMHTSGDQGYRSPSLATPTNLGPGTMHSPLCWNAAPAMSSVGVVKENGGVFYVDEESHEGVDVAWYH